MQVNLDAPNEPVPEMPGYLYVFRDIGEHSNEIKVGYSIHPEKRVRQLHTSGTIWKMQIYTQWRVSNMRIAEKVAHENLKEHRINPRREFFEIAPRPYFSEPERNNDIITDSILWHLVGILDDELGHHGVKIDWIIDPEY